MGTLRRVNLRTRLFYGAAIVGCVDGGFAWADPEEGAKPVQLEEVIVTVNKRTERIGDVAMGVSAISGDDLALNQTLDLVDLSSKVPGVAISSTGGLYTRIIVRGLNSGGTGATVATVVDDTPISFSGSNGLGGLIAADFDTYDLERVEILKGPQGTLYGATAEGGLIKYVTKTPNLNEFQAGFEAGGQSVDHGNAAGSGKGYVNIPLLDGTAAVRVSGYYEGLPGFVSNNLLDSRNTNDGHRYGGRISFALQPTEDLHVRLTAFNQTRDLNGSGLLRVLGDTNPDKPFQLVDGYDMSGYGTNPSNIRLGMYQLNIEDDLHWARLQSITSYGTVHENFAQDGETIPPILMGGFGLPQNSVIDYETHSLKKFNQELRLSSDATGLPLGRGLEWQLGAFYTHETVGYDLNFLARAYPGGELLPDPFGNIATSSSPSSYNEIAGYADGTLHFTSQFDIESGIRVSRNRQRLDTVEEGLLLTGGPSTVLPSLSSSESVVTYSVAPRYHFTPDLLAYARAASGYRPGGPQAPILGAPAAVPATYRSDKTMNYEAGLKGEFFDRRVSVSLDGFYINWRDIQISETFNVADPLTGVTTPYLITGNAGRAVSKGAELELNWAPLANLNVGFVMGYTDAYLSQTPPPGSAGAEGDRLEYVPRLTSNLSVEYGWMLPGGYRPFVGSSWAYTGTRESSLIVGGTQTKLPSYNNVSLHLGVQKGGYAVQIYGKNLTDERGILTYGGNGFYGPTIAAAEYGSIAITTPRTVGIRVSADY